MDGFAGTLLSLEETGSMLQVQAAAPGGSPESRSTDETPAASTEPVDVRRCDLAEKIVTYWRISE